MKRLMLILIMLVMLPAAALANTVTLTITPNPAFQAVTGYNIYKATTSGGYNFAMPLANVPATNTNAQGEVTFVDTGVPNTGKFFYVVRAVNAAGESANSNEVVANPLPPTAPTVTINSILSAQLDVNNVKVASGPVGTPLEYNTTVSKKEKLAIKVAYQ